MRNVQMATFDRESSCETWSYPSELEPQSQSPRPTSGRPDKSLALLEKIIEGNIIPRLLLDHRHTLVTAQSAAADATAARLAKSVDEFAELVVKRDAAASSEYFRSMRAQGASVESLFQDLLAPAARRLGVLWEEDINDFMDVTRGFTHLHHLVQEFGDDFKNEARAPISSRRALLMPMPGEQHTFGISLVGEYFKREGWRVWGGPPRSLDDVIELVDGQWFDMIGLSVSVVPEPKKIAAQIRQIRKASHNKNVTVLVGGFVFLDQPELVGILGADATAPDGLQAVRQVSERIGSRLK
jgi:MerR family transcriptional regulator, light-induced transcriptional regulator